MARISVLKESVLLCGRSGITPFVWGHRGLGKSAIMRQLAATHNMGFVDERCSQLEASDLRGMPERSNGRTIYLPPMSMPQGDLNDAAILEMLLAPFKGRLAGDTPMERHESLLKLVASDTQVQRVYEATLQELQPRFERGILFLDELNRGQDDVLQAAFQLVLDRKVGQYSLPPGWFPVAAGNYMEGYQVNGFTDPAFLDRFCHLIFSGGESTLEDWVMYMTQVHGSRASEVIEYASQNVTHLDGKIDGELGFVVQPSRRSWEAVVRVLTEFARGGYSDEARQAVLTGLIGAEQATAFGRYSCPVKPRELLDQGVKPLKAKLNTLKRNELMGLMWGVISFVKNRMKEEKIKNVCADFAEWMAHHNSDKDLTVAFCRALVSTGTEHEKTRAAVISNARLAQMISKFNKKVGGEETFIDVLTARPALQAIIAKVAWGGDANED